MNTAEVLRPSQLSLKPEKGSRRWKEWIIGGAVAALGISLILAAA